MQPTDPSPHVIALFESLTKEYLFKKNGKDDNILAGVMSGVNHPLMNGMLPSLIVLIIVRWFIRKASPAKISSSFSFFLNKQPLVRRSHVKYLRYTNLTHYLAKNAYLVINFSGFNTLLLVLVTI